MGRAGFDWSERRAGCRTEISEILSAGRDERMVGGQGRRSDEIRSPITRFGFGGCPEAFADDPEVVQRVGEVRMSGAELRLLQRGGLTQELLC